MNVSRFFRGLRAICPRLYWSRLSRQEVLDLQLDRFKRWEGLRLSVSNWSDTEEFGYTLCVRRYQPKIAA